MAMGTRKHRQRQEQLWIRHTELATGPGRPFYLRLNELLDQEKFDEFAEGECAAFYADQNGRPSWLPGTYFRLLLVGHFEGIDCERGIAWGRRSGRHYNDPRNTGRNGRKCRTATFRNRNASVESGPGRQPNTRPCMRIGEGSKTATANV
jgi:hypothetical protein